MDSPAFYHLGRITSLGNLTDWMLIELALAATGRPLRDVVTKRNSELVKDAKDAVVSSSNIGAAAVSELEQLLEDISESARDRNAAVHSAYLLDAATHTIHRARINKKVKSWRSETDSLTLQAVSLEDLQDLAQDMLDHLADLSEWLDRNYPARGYRTASTFAPLRVKVIGNQHESSVAPIAARRRAPVCFGTLLGALGRPLRRWKRP